MESGCNVISAVNYTYDLSMLFFSSFYFYFIVFISSKTRATKKESVLVKYKVFVCLQEMLYSVAY